MIWAYLLIAMAVLAGGVTAVETYNHAVSSKATAEARATSAESAARAERQARTDLQELVNHDQSLTGSQKAAMGALDRRLASMEAALRKAAASDPKAYECESRPVPDAARELRRATFGAAGDQLLRAEGKAGADAGSPAPGRDVRGPAPGSEPVAPSAPLVQQRQGDSPATPRAAEPSTQSLRARLQALMRR